MSLICGCCGGLMREVAQSVMPQTHAGSARYEQCDGASDRQEQDKIQDDEGLQEYRGNDERALDDAAGMGRVWH